MTDAAQPQRAGFTFAELPQLLMRGEIALAAGVLGILAIMLVPLPPVLLDFLLAISITLSILVLMTALMIKKP
ncbi:MAG TPA: FHIPEP family type III secretion protein, partial [Terricaulis sp.]|nr:FHIPEP family type III secretion protein [Terricaulis sp.]